MIVDIHGHTNAPPSLYAYKSLLLSSKGAHGKGNPSINEEQLANLVNNHLKNNRGRLHSHSTNLLRILPCVQMSAKLAPAERQ